ncbi:hypothetical protein [Streptomyces sp. x-80]|uniref:hypothetical protein n=1 Tax=Streptomyces sp. x-80 TaxID=2789282 RepID=UPI0039815EDA
MRDTPGGEHRNALDAPAVTVVTPEGRQPLDAVLDTLSGGGPVAWASVTGKPATFPPTVGTGAKDAAAGNHTHTGLLTGSATKVANSDAAEVAGLVDDFNALLAALRARGVISG